jgi:hypothetical protein
MCIHCSYNGPVTLQWRIECDDVDVPAAATDDDENNNNSLKEKAT